MADVLYNPPSTPTAVVDPNNGRLMALDDPSQLPDLINYGYRVATPEEIRLHQLKRQYDTLGQTAAAAGEGALDTLLPVIGPLAEQALGVSAESQHFRRMFHPWATGAGAVGAGVGGALAGVGLPGLAAKAGAGVAAGVGGGVLGSALGAATEGFLYSASDAANRAVMHEPGLTAEAALRQVGMTTAISGGLGMLGGLAKAIIRDHAEQWAGDAQEFAADRLHKVYGGIQSDRAKLIAKYGEDGYLQRMKEIAEDPLMRPGPLDNSKSLYDRAGQASDEAWATMKGEMAKAGQAGATINGDAVLQRLRAAVDELDTNPFVPPSATSRLDGMLEKFGKAFGGKEITVEDTHQLRKWLSQAIGYSRGAVDFDSNVAKGTMHDWRGIMSDAIGEALDQSGVGSKAWAAANRRYHLASIAQTLAQRGINRAEGNNILSPTELLTGLTGAVLGGEHAAGEGGAIGNILGHGLIGSAGAALIRRQGSNVLFWLGDRASKVLGDLHSGVESEIGDAVERAFSGGTAAAATRGVDYLFTPKNFGERSAAINRAATDPTQFTLNDPVLDSFTLPVMNEMRSRVAAATIALGQTIPRYQQVGPLDPAYAPSGSQLNRLNRVSEVAHDPLAVVNRLGDGSLLRDHVQALDAVWPAYAAVIRRKALDRLTTGIGKGEAIRPHLRAGLALLLGQDLARGTTPGAIAAAQAAYAARVPPPQAPPPPGSRASSRVRNVETKIGSRLATSNDAAVEHLNRPD